MAAKQVGPGARHHHFGFDPFGAQILRAARTKVDVLSFPIALQYDGFQKPFGPSLNGKNLAAHGTANKKAGLFLVLQQRSTRADRSPFFNQKPELLVAKYGGTNGAGSVGNGKPG